MPLENTVFLKESEMLSAEQWQAEFDRLNLDLQLSDNFDVLNFEGFVAASLEGRKAGFEYYFDALHEDMLDAELKQQVGDRTHIVTLVTHSDLDKTRSSCLAAAVLCQAVNGLLWDGDEECIYTAEDCAGWINTQTPE